jgi:multisubunit Na+/H+ antiporter MnhB subunit
MLFIGLGVMVAPPVYAMDLFNTCTDPGCGVLNDKSLQQDSAGFKVKNIVNTALYILGGLAVIMIVISGMRIVMANGDPGSIKRGRDGVMWAVVGVVVAILAYSIVNFVVNWNWTK